MFLPRRCSVLIFDLGSGIYSVELEEAQARAQV
jgi:hypothetical protein